MRVGNPWGVADIFAKIPGGWGSRLSGKIARGFLILGFVEFLLTSFFENLHAGAVSSPLSLPLPLCAFVMRPVQKRASMCVATKVIFPVNRQNPLKLTLSFSNRLKTIEKIKVNWFFYIGTLF